MSKLILILLALIICYSCSSEIKENKTISEKKTFDLSLKKAEILLDVKCKADSTISYALYIPNSYNTEKGFPIIFFFDSHAKGSLPVTKYKDIAEKYGFIIAGSNNSKNGQAADISQMISKTTMADANSRLSINNSRIYTAGFSGGARVAGNIAMNGGIAGVIACSAGLQNIPTDKKFDFVGIAGTFDMNYLELEKLNTELDKTKLSQYLLLFEGKHEWAPVETMSNAFAFLEFSAMKNKLCAENNILIKEFESQNIEKVQKLIAQKKFYEAHKIYKMLEIYLNGLANISDFTKEISSIEKNQEMKKIMAEKQKNISKENTLQQAYLQALQTKSAEWWKIETAKLNVHIAKANDVFEKAMFHRVLGFLSLVSFSYVNNALHGNDLKTAENFNTIYTIVDPENPDPRYFAACIYAKKSDSKNAFEELNKAVKLGFDDIQRLQNEESFQAIRQKKEFSELIEKIQKKK